MTNFSPSLALLCVRASSRAYVADTDSEPSTDTHYLILELPDRIIVAFRGTSSLEDFICDADFFTTRININFDERVHLGFYRAFKSIESKLKARLDEIVKRRAGACPSPGAATQTRTKNSESSNAMPPLDLAVAEDGHTPSRIPNPASRIPIIFTGHSLGGALAILAAYYLNHFYQVEAIYTFGAPDVGNADFAQRYNKLGKEHCALGDKTFCLANAGDPVTWLPPYRFGFRRVGKFFFLPGVTWMVSGFNAPPLARVITGAIQVLQNLRHGKLALLPNHAIALYKQRVEKLAGARPVPGRSTLAAEPSLENLCVSHEPKPLRAGTARAPHRTPRA